MAARWWLVVMVLARGACAAEVFVADGAAAGGDGSAAKPFTTLGAALKAARGGDTITLRAGTYREAVQVNVAGTAEQPTVVRAAPGARVVLSGFAPLTGWQPRGDGAYTTATDAAPADLYVGLTAQPVAWWPDANEPMRYLVEPAGGEQAPTFRDRDDLTAEVLASVAKTPASAMAFVYNAFGNSYGTAPIAALDLAQKQVKLAPGRLLTWLKGKGDRWRLANHAALVRRAGQWAYEKLGDKQFRVTFFPARPDDLKSTQVRRAGTLVYVGQYNKRIAHVRLEGLELAGSSQLGLSIQGCDQITVERCVIHNNTGNGVFVRHSTGIRLAGNLVLANGNGIGIASSSKVVVERNDVGLNMVDGLIVAGNVSGRPGAEPETDDVLVRRNYLHHHLLLGHPDNMQTYRGVHRLRIEDTLALWGGQGLMTEETDDSALHNCVFFGTAAVAVIFGHANAHRWTVERSTVGFGGWGSFSFTGRDYRLSENIVVNSALPLPPTLTSDHNLLWHNDPQAPIALTSTPRWQRFTDPAQAFAVTRQEEHSRRADPRFRAAPRLQVVAPWADANRADRLSLVWGGRNETSQFAVGDRLELNGDGVLRKVTAIEGDLLRFDPPLPARPFRDTLVWNWQQAETTTLDLRPRDDSPALKLGKTGGPVGASLDIGAYQRGDFDGDGQRDLPPLPADLHAGLPNPNAVVVPLYGA